MQGDAAEQSIQPLVLTLKSKTSKEGTSDKQGKGEAGRMNDDGGHAHDGKRWEGEAQGWYWERLHQPPLQLLF